MGLIPWASYPFGTEALLSHRNDQRRNVPVQLVTEAEGQRLRQTLRVILTKIWLVKVSKQFDWPLVGTEEPQSPISRGKVTNWNAGIILKD